MNKPKKIFKFNLYWMYGIILVALVLMYQMKDNSVSKEVNWTEFKEYVEQGGVTEITVYGKKNYAEAVVTDSVAKQLFKNGEYTPEKGTRVIINTGIPSTSAVETASKEWKESGAYTGPVTYNQDSDMWSNILWGFGPILLLVLFYFLIMRAVSGGAKGGGGGVFSVGKAKAQLFDKNNANKVTFDDVAGLSEAKTEVEEIVHFLRSPKSYTELGGRIPKGALLVGPPGTGKTLLAKAVAGEANVPFLSLSGSDFVEMFVGVGASRVRDLFRQAKEKAPCIVFIDEIDAVGRARGKNVNAGSNDERENTLNQLLTEMDGFGANSGVIILAATNRVDILDKALLRAGRFDRQIYVDLPELNDRKEIFQVHLRKIKMDDTVDIDLLARQTPGFSGADIANVCNEAALIAARNKKKAVDKEDFMAAVDRIIGGLEKRSKITTEEERRSIAIHEAGHATISWNLEYANPLVKVTIVPRGKALGAAWYLPEERQITTTQAMLDEMCATLGGRAAEELFLGRISTGAANDLERVTKTAYAMVMYYGMSKALPNISYYDSTGQAYGFTKPYGDERAAIIDKEVSAIIAEQYERAKAILTEYAAGHHELTDVLLTREVIYTEDVERIFGKRKWVSRTDEIMRLNEEQKAREAAKAEEEKKKEEAADAESSETPADENSDNGGEKPAEQDAPKTETVDVSSNTSVTPPPVPEQPDDKE